MNFSKIYIQDNFVPNIVEDQFRRKVIGVEISLNEGESLDEAKLEAETFIKDYIQQNKVFPDHNHIEEIIVQSKQSLANSLVRDINSCTEIKVLESYRLIVKGKPELQAAYDTKLNQLKNSTNGNNL